MYPFDILNKKGRRNELSQSVARLVISASVLSYSLLYSVFGQHYPQQDIVNWILATFFMYSIIINVIIRLNPGPIFWRILSVIVVDLVSLSLGFYLAGSYGGIFYPFILWVIVGNGLRFGERYLLWATMVSFVALIVAMSNSEYWQNQFSLALGLIVGIIILPLFYTIILRELEAVNNKLKKQIDVTAYAATYDPSTKLYNRFIFMDFLAHAIKRAERDKNRFVVLIMSLDSLRSICDKYGYEISDKVLENIADRLRDVIRGVDIAGRLSDDEVVVMLTDIESKYNAREAAERVIEIFRSPFNIGRLSLSITANAGFSIFPDDADDADSLMQCADIAVNRARKRGDNEMQSYSYIKYRLKPQIVRYLP